MSAESAKAFVERMKTDQEFADRVMMASNRETRMEIVNDAGYEFTPEEMDVVREQLSDEDLDAVAGGKWTANGDCADRTSCYRGAIVQS